MNHNFDHFDMNFEATRQINVTLSDDGEAFLFTYVESADVESAETAAFYDVSLKDFRRSKEFWIGHLSEKTWFTPELAFEMAEIEAMAP